MSFFDSNEAKDIHQLESMDLTSGKEFILVDTGEVTKKMTLDALIGFFLMRIGGNTAAEIDVNKLAAASCIHLIPYGEILPESKRIADHYYIQITDPKSEDLVNQALLQDANGKLFSFKTRPDDIECLYAPKFRHVIEEADVDAVKLMEVKVKYPENTTYFSEVFVLTVVTDTGTFTDTVTFSAEYSGVIKNVVFKVLADSNIHLTCNVDNDDRGFSIWLHTNGKVKEIAMSPTYSVGYIDDTDTTYMAARLFDTYTVNFTLGNFNKDKHYCFSDTFLVNCAGESKGVNDDIRKEMSRIETLITKTETEPGYNAVILDPQGYGEGWTTIPAVNFSVIDADRLFLKINADGSVSVAKDGFYIMSLKQALKIIKGSAKFTIDVYVNNAKINDLTYEGMLSDIGYSYSSTGAVTLRLHENDSIKVAINVENSEQLQYVNNSVLQVSKIMNVIDPIDFGNLSQERYNINNLGEAGQARLFTDLLAEADSSTDAYELPLVEQAKVDVSSLVEPD